MAPLTHSAPSLPSPPYFRYGLKNLAEVNLLDLIASVRHHYKSSQRVRWFAIFCSLVEVGALAHTFASVQVCVCVCV